MQQYLPFTVLKPSNQLRLLYSLRVATVLTVYGIETIDIFFSKIVIVFKLQQYLPFTVLKPAHVCLASLTTTAVLQQYLPLAVCDEGCEAAEEQSDDEARTSLVPD